MAPASLASSTSRGSRSASLMISDGVIALPSSTPPLITSSGCALAKSRRPLAASTTSPSTNATADGPASSDDSWSLSPASVTEILVRVFFTTANVAFPPRDLRSSASWATVSPRYSVSTAPDESLNRSVSSATAATFSALAMCLLSIVEKHCCVEVLICVTRTCRRQQKRPGARRTGRQRPAFRRPGGTAQFTCAGCPAPGSRDPGPEPSAVASDGIQRSSAVTGYEQQHVGSNRFPAGVPGTAGTGAGAPRPRRMGAGAPRPQWMAPWIVTSGACEVCEATDEVRGDW